MPDKKLSKPRIKEHIRKYAPIYLVGFVICLLLTDLLYAWVDPRIKAQYAGSSKRKKVAANA